MGLFDVRFRQSFPLMSSLNSRKTSERDIGYNCFGWAVGRLVFMQPIPGYHWPAGVQRNLSDQAFVDAFQAEGFQQCADGVVEEGFDKIALYHDGEHVTHAAKLLSNGKWSSKLGQEEDIEHDTLSVLENGRYGKLYLFMKRASM